MDDVLHDVLQRNVKVLVIAVGDDARRFFETDLKKDHGSTFNSLNDISRARSGVRILFLEKLQYLFMYLTHVEIELHGRSDDTSTNYDEIVLYGLESLILAQESSQISTTKLVYSKLSIPQLRHLNLILNALYRLQNQYGVRVDVVAAKETGERKQDLDFMISYWKRVYSVETPRVSD